MSTEACTTQVEAGGSVWRLREDDAIEHVLHRDPKDGALRGEWRSADGSARGKRPPPDLRQAADKHDGYLAHSSELLEM